MEFNEPGIVFPIDLNIVILDNDLQRITISESESSITVENIVNNNYFDESVGMNLYKVTAGFHPKQSCFIKGFSIELDHKAKDEQIFESIKKGFHWIPNIKAHPADVAGDHTFRSPAIIVSAKKSGAALIPDLNSLKMGKKSDHYLDLRFDDDSRLVRACYGMKSLSPQGHIYYRPDEKPFKLNEEGAELHFFILTFENCSSFDILKATADFEWNTFSRDYENELLPQTVPFSKYAKYGNGMALQYLWQEGPSKGTGGIVLSTFQRDDGVFSGREYADDLWFHSWFNNMRTAYGLYSHGKLLENADWIEKAKSIAHCILSAPMKSGVFPTIYAPHENSWINSSLQGGGPALYSLPDCAWTAIWLRKFNNELEHIEGSKKFLKGFKDFLLEHQDKSGGFPCWVNSNDLTADERLNNSAPGALALWFLGEELIAEKSKDEGKIIAALKIGADHLISNILPKQKFEDFELYYSCSRKPLDFHDSMSLMYGQNTLAMQWCSEAFRVLYKLTEEMKYLDAGLFCLNLLSMYQQVWNPPYLNLYTFGGFGVMNTDAEWNDARQAQFAETFANYYDLTGDFIYLERAVAAAKASFALMAIKENRQVCPNNYQGTGAFFEVHGGSAENYGHAGYDARSYQSGFHWGTGSALTTAARIAKRYGDLYIDARMKKAIGIDGVAVNNVALEDMCIELEIDALEEKRIIKTIVNGMEIDQTQLKIKGFTVSETEKPGFFIAEKSSC